MTSFNIIKKSKRSSIFYKKYLSYATNEINITDKYTNSIIQSDNFIDHIHDQSIFSFLYKKYKLRAFKDLTQFGKYPIGYSRGEYIEDLTHNKLYYLSNDRKYRYYKYTENYNTVIYPEPQIQLKAIFKYSVNNFLDSFNIYKNIPLLVKNL